MEYQEPTQRRGIPTWALVLLGGGGCVVVIIAVLAAILFPVFAKARGDARRAGCLNNLKSCGAAFATYAADWNDRLPHSFSPANDEAFETAAAPAGDSWVTRVVAYHGSRAECYCIRDPAGLGSVSYYYKHAVNLAARQGLRRKDFSRPTWQVMLYERGSFHWGGGPIVEGAFVNAAFVDGHVSVVRLSDVAPDKEPKYFNWVSPLAPQAVKKARPYKDPRYCYDNLP